MKRCLVIGSPIAHSRSPLIHRLFAEQCGLALCYEKREVRAGDVARVLEDFRREAVTGINVTLPLKEEACAAADVLHPRAAAAGAANTLWFDGDGRMNADNTDGYGLLSDLRRLGVELRGASVLLLGAGGAARGVLGALKDAGPARLIVCNRTPGRARTLARQHGVEFEIRDAVRAQALDVVINATSIGIANDGEIPLAAGAVGPATVCYDMVYGARDTAFLRWAAACGARHRHDGLGMLVGQAAEAFRLWHGLEVDTAPVIDTVRGRLLA